MKINENLFRNELIINPVKKIFLLLILASFSIFVSAQKSDTIKKVNNFGTVVTLTSKGISTIPNLTLGKPAVIFDLTMGRKLTFEPQFRFALEGKPWSFLFWFRYKLVTAEKFRMTIGAHPAYSFKSITDTVNGLSRDLIRADRYLAGDLTPTYFLSRSIGIGMYYLYIRGIEKDITRNTHFISFRTIFSNIRISDKFYFRFNPQVYYLNMDDRQGWYFNSTLVLARMNFPLSVATLISKSIETEILAEDDFLWNISLIYSFNRNYVKQ